MWEGSRRRRGGFNRRGLAKYFTSLCDWERLRRAADPFARTCTVSSPAFALEPFALKTLRAITDDGFCAASFLYRKSFVKTSGSKGFHIVVPLDGSSQFDVVWRFAHGLGAELVKRHPERFTQEFSKADRGERILVDTGRNGYGATFAAPYAVRSKPGAPVSAPCTWEELETGRVTPRTFSLRNMRERLTEAGDLWQTLPEEAQSLAEPNRKLMSLLSASEWQASFGAATRRPGSRHKKIV